MAETVDFGVTEIPVALEDTIAFTVGNIYTVSNDSDVIVFYRLADAAPAADVRGHALRPYREEEFTFVSTTEKTWVWTRDPPAALVISERAP